MTYNNAYNEILNDAEYVAFDNIDYHRAEEIVYNYVSDPQSDLAYLLTYYCHAKQNNDYAMLHAYFDELAFKAAAATAKKHYQQALDFGALREDN